MPAASARQRAVQDQRLHTRHAAQEPGWRSTQPDARRPFRRPPAGEWRRDRRRDAVQDQGYQAAARRPPLDEMTTPERVALEACER